MSSVGLVESFTMIDITDESVLPDVSLTDMFREYMPKSSRVILMITPVSAPIVKWEVSLRKYLSIW